MSEHARKRARAVLRGRDDGTIILLPDRSFVGWYRHITLVLLALAYLAGICATAHGSTVPPTTSGPPSTSPVLALTVVFRAPSPRTAHLAHFFVRTPGAGLVVVASLSPKCCQLFPYQTSSEGWLMLASSPFFTCICGPSDLFPDFPAISRKYRSSAKFPGSVVGLVCSFVLLRKEC